MSDVLSAVVIIELQAMQHKRELDATHSRQKSGKALGSDKVNVKNTTNESRLLKVLEFGTQFKC